jgi:hypothetical protein
MCDYRLMNTSLKIAVSALAVVVVASLLVYNSPGCRRQRKTWESNTIGLSRTITWTGHDGTKKVWETRTKVFTGEAGVIRFFDSNGKVIILMPGICVEER